MNWDRHCRLLNGGSAPETPGFNAVAPEWLFYGAADAAPAFPAAESTLGSHPCVALSSAQALPEWINRSFAGNRFPANGDNTLNFVSHAKGSLQTPPKDPAAPPYPSCAPCPYSNDVSNRFEVTCCGGVFYHGLLADRLRRSRIGRDIWLGER